ncbi:MAG: hypothetical protein U0T69_06565 [Chitinophagales bacterium]
MNNQGFILREYVKKSSYTQDEFAKLLGFKQRQSLVYHFKSEVLDNDLVKKLKNAKLYEGFIQYVRNNYTENKGEPPDCSHYIKEIKSLKREIELQNKIIKMYEANTIQAHELPKLKTKQS